MFCLFRFGKLYDDVSSGDSVSSPPAKISPPDEISQIDLFDLELRLFNNTAQQT